MAGKHETEVVVVGAGPVGLFAALNLKGAGLEVRVFDAGRRTAAHSYALVLHAATLRLFDGHGLAAACERAGKRVSTIGLYEGAQRRGEVDLAKAGGPFPYVLVLPQSRLEAILEEALRKAGVEVAWDHRVQALEPDMERVRLTVAKLDKVSTGYPIAHTEVVVDKTFDLDAAYVVGADGYDSFVRRRLGISQSARGTSEVFSVFQFEATGDVPAEGRLMIEAGRVGGYWPMPDGRCRFSFPVASEAEHRPDEARLVELISTRAPWFSGRVGGIEWTALGLFERKLADAFGAGRVWLAGDAAHLTGPLGAQSMNAGLAEAEDLSARLARVVRQGAPASLLEEYGAACQAAWGGLLDPASASAGRRGLLRPCLPATGADLEALLGQAGA